VTESPTVWYRVRDLDAARAFYTDKLGFEEASIAMDKTWAALLRGRTSVHLTEDELGGGEGVAMVDVEDVRVEAARLREENVEVGVVLELHGEIRIVDVFDPDGNRLQLSEVLAP
jgi:catechol 2,3-dioxygenase-like lactoylglutathione lyase family enzyme